MAVLVQKAEVAEVGAAEDDVATAEEVAGFDSPGSSLDPENLEIANSVTPKGAEGRVLTEVVVVVLAEVLAAPAVAEDLLVVAVVPAAPLGKALQAGLLVDILVSTRMDAANTLRKPPRSSTSWSKSILKTRNTATC